MTQEQAMHDLDVSRETIEKLKQFEALVRKWNPKINLVSKSSLDNLWSRHIVDSIQVIRTLNPKGKWVDLGSGGGFPGLVVALFASTELPDLTVTLIESDQRKAAFLRNAARECQATCTVLSKRIEQVEPQCADILSARALADLAKLLEFSERHLKPDGTALFPKGITWEKEVEDARLKWSFDIEVIKSITEPNASILKIKGVTRV